MVGNAAVRFRRLIIAQTIKAPIVKAAATPMTIPAMAPDEIPEPEEVDEFEDAADGM